MSAGDIITLAICVPVTAAGLYVQRRPWVALWIGLRGIPAHCAAILRGEPDGAFKGLEDAIRYLDEGGTR